MAGPNQILLIPTVVITTITLYSPQMVTGYISTPPDQGQEKLIHPPLQISGECRMMITSGEPQSICQALTLKTTNLTLQLPTRVTYILTQTDLEERDLWTFTSQNGRMVNLRSHSQ